MAPISQITSSLLMGFAFCFLMLAVCTNHWRGGNLLNYQVFQSSGTATTCAGLLLTGLVLWAVAFLLGLVRFCSREELIGQRGVGLCYLVSLYLGTLFTIIGVLVYTARLGHEWSYLLTGVAWTCSLVVSFIAIVMCRCRAKRV